MQIAITLQLPGSQFMVVAGYTVFVPGNSSAVNAIRALRALRPLRTITRFESLRGVIVCFLEVGRAVRACAAS